VEDSTVKLDDIQQALRNSLISTQQKHDCKLHNDLLNFQRLYEKDHRCNVLKKYSQKNSILSNITDIRYWEALQFESKADITMFVLKWA